MDFDKDGSIWATYFLQCSPILVGVQEVRFAHLNEVEVNQNCRDAHPDGGIGRGRKDYYPVRALGALFDVFRYKVKLGERGASMSYTCLESQLMLVNSSYSADYRLQR